MGNLESRINLWANGQLIVGQWRLKGELKTCNGINEINEIIWIWQLGQVVVSFSWVNKFYLLLVFDSSEEFLIHEDYWAKEITLRKL